MEKIESLEKRENKSNVIPIGDKIIKFTYFFDDIKDKEVPLICEEAFGMTKRILDEASIKF